MISKETLSANFCIVLILLILDTFFLTPFGFLSTYILLISSSLGHLLFVFRKKIFEKKIIYWYLIGIFLMIVSLLNGYFINNQSLVSGLVANFKFYNIGSVLLIIFLIKKYKISEKLFIKINKVFYLYAFVIFLLFFLDYSYIHESELTGKITEVTIGTFNKDFINFGSILYLSYFLFSKKLKYFYISIFFMSINHLYDFQRAVFAVFIIVFFIALYKLRRKIKLSRTLFQLSFISLFFGIISLSIGSENKIYYKISESIKIFDKNESMTTIEDTSVAVRLLQGNFAIEKFQERPLFGHGFFRSSDFDKVIGGENYFHLSDIGVVGFLYSFGVLGILIYLIQLKNAFKIRLTVNTSAHEFALVLFLIFVLIFSIITGKSLNNFSLYFLIIALIFHFKSQENIV